MSLEKLADDIQNELFRLEVSTEENPYSGLMASVPSVVSEIPLVNLVKIYDDYANGFYDGEKLLSHLKTLDPKDVSLENIWEIIAEFEV